VPNLATSEYLISRSVATHYWPLMATRTRVSVKHKVFPAYAESSTNREAQQFEFEAVH
jgi:hypothetical protein